MKNKNASAGTTAKSFAYVSGLIGMYKHTWAPDTSPRLLSWVDMFNDLIKNHPDAFLDWCAASGFNPSDNGYKLLV